MTTVGYGDYSPQTTAGRVLVALGMLTGLIGTSMPLAIVGNAFSHAWDSRTVALIGERLRNAITHSGEYTNSGIAEDLTLAFSVFDSSKSGVITYKEFRRTIAQVLKLKVSPKRLREAWRIIDADDTEVITFTEFVAAFWPEVDLHETDIIKEAIDLIRVHNEKFADAITEAEDFHLHDSRLVGNASFNAVGSPPHQSPRVSVNPGHAVPRGELDAALGSRLDRLEKKTQQEIKMMATRQDELRESVDEILNLLRGGSGSGAKKQWRC